jgi:hypothetical protein
MNFEPPDPGFFDDQISRQALASGPVPTRSFEDRGLAPGG